MRCGAGPSRSGCKRGPSRAGWLRLGGCIVRHRSHAMTKSEFSNAKRSFQRQISWAVMAYFVLWLGVFFAVGVAFKYWFHTHVMISNLVLVAAVVIFLVPVFLISKRLRERHGLVCRSCGLWLFSDPAVSSTGRCSRCQTVIYD